jgi:hypothetical protein
MRAAEDAYRKAEVRPKDLNIVEPHEAVVPTERFLYADRIE